MIKIFFRKQLFSGIKNNKKKKRNVGGEIFARGMSGKILMACCKVEIVCYVWFVCMCECVCKFIYSIVTPMGKLMDIQYIKKYLTNYHPPGCGIIWIGNKGINSIVSY